MQISDQKRAGVGIPKSDKTHKQTSSELYSYDMIISFYIYIFKHFFSFWHNRILEAHLKPTFCPSPESSHFSEELWFIPVGNGYQRSKSRLMVCPCLLRYICFLWTKQVNTHIEIYTHAYILTHIHEYFQPGIFQECDEHIQAQLSSMPLSRLPASIILLTTTSSTPNCMVDNLCSL